MTKETQYGSELRKILILIASALDVKHPMQIDIEEMTLSTGIEILVHADDYGKLCGTGGVMINALKKFAELAGVKKGRRTRLMLSKPIPGDIGPRPRFQEAENWNSEPIRVLCESVCGVMIGATFKVIARDKSETTTLEVIVDASGETFDKWAPQVEQTLGTIFHAIGKVMGRNEVVVNVGAKEA